MGRSTSWLHERLLAKMLGFDSSTDEGMGEFKKFIKIVERGGTGKQRGRPDWVPTPEPCNGVQIDMTSETVDNPLHLLRRGTGEKLGRRNRASTDEPTVMWLSKVRFTMPFVGTAILL